MTTRNFGAWGLGRFGKVFASFLTCVLLLTAAPLSTQATTASGEQAAGEIADIFIEQGIALEGYEVGFLAKGDIKIIDVTLKAGVNYIFVVGGCNDAYDLDLGVFDPQTEQALGIDEKTDKVAVVQYTPEETRQYAVVIQMADSTSDGAHYAILLGVLSNAEGSEGKADTMVLSSLDLDMPIQNLNGTETTLGAIFQQTGAKVMYIRLWAKWCPPCIAMLPNLEERNATLPDYGVAVISLNAENFGEGGDSAAAKVTIAKHKLKTPTYVAVPGSEIFSKLSIDSVPRSVIIRDTGEVIYNGHPVDDKIEAVMTSLGVTNFELMAGLSQ